MEHYYTPEQQEKHRAQLEENRKKLQARKARTHRLIVRGAIVESALPELVDLTDEEFQANVYRLAKNGRDTGII